MVYEFGPLLALIRARNHDGGTIGIQDSLRGRMYIIDGDGLQKIRQPGVVVEA